MKKWLKVTLIIAGVLILLYLLGCALVVGLAFGFDNGPVPVSCENIIVNDDSIEFDVDYWRDGFLRYTRYTCRIEGDCMYVQIHASLGGFTWPHHVKIRRDMTQINEVYLEDGQGASLIWSRE